MGISLSQYRAAIGLWRRPSALSKKSYDIDAYESLHSWKINNVLGLINVLSLICIILSKSALIDLGLTSSLMSRQCLQSLLIISGVEQNPGPTGQQDIIEELCRKSSNDVINKVLRAYPLGQTLTQQKTAINKFKKEELLVTLEFLKVSNQDKYIKPQLVHNLIVRIQNLLPDTCGLCKQEYNTSLDVTPLLSCEVCGQGSHNSCIITILGITDETETSSLDPQKVRKIIIPLDLPGVHYLCMTCSSDTIPDENEGILKKQIHDSPDVEDKSTDGAQSHEAKESAPAPLIPVSQEDTIVSQSDPEINESQPQTQSQPQPQSSNQGVDGRPICPFFKKGQCKHGISGRGCNNRHPKPCMKLIRHGAWAPNGCTLGRSRCDKFHPSMCSASITKGECTETACKLWHVAGTKRKSSKNKSVNSVQQIGNKIQAANPIMTKENPNDFLGLLQSWKLELMEAMDTKLAMALKSPIITSHRPPILEPLSMMAHNHLLPQNYYNMAVGEQRNVMTSGQPVLVQMAPNVMYR